MAAISLDQIMQLADQLSQAEQVKLLLFLQHNLQAASPVTREQLLAEMDLLRAAGAFDGVESLRNRYADPDTDLSDEALRASIDTFATEWKQDIDGLATDN
jgi:hypothetical protein